MIGVTHYLKKIKSYQDHGELLQIWNYLRFCNFMVTEKNDGFNLKKYGLNGNILKN